VTEPRVVVVGLGPAGPDLVTPATTAALARIPTRFVRTTRHPAASVVDGATSFDHVYERAETMDDVYRAIVDELVGAAVAEGEVVYAVPGSPAVAEHTVELLLVDDRVEVEVVPALSFLDLAWARLGVDPVAVGARIVDGHRFAVEAAGERGPLLVAQCDRPSVLSDIKLAVDDPPELPVTVLQRLGLPDEARFDVAWADLDRSVEPDHLTSLWIPRLAAPVASEMQRFVALVGTLRERCPWDAEQTHHSLTRHLLEESYEVLDALEGLPEGAGADDPAYAHVEEELGDLLFQVVFHSRIAAEAGAFTLADVARTVHDKLVGRHPHVFGDVAVEGAHDVLTNWERIKREEKGRESAFDGIPRALPALAYAAKVQKKAERLGLDVDVPTLPVELGADDIGDALLAVDEVARAVGVDAEVALRRAVQRRLDRYRAAEADQAR
jgi:tetrapyrrole methylase family protein/MazG family protein